MFISKLTFILKITYYRLQQQKGTFFQLTHLSSKLLNNVIHNNFRLDAHGLKIWEKVGKSLVDFLQGFVFKLDNFGLM